MDDGDCSGPTVNCKNEDGSYMCTCEAGYELFAYDGFNGVNTRSGENGLKPGDVVRINHACVGESSSILSAIDHTVMKYS